MRPYGGESDLQALVDLFDACEQVDQLESSTSIAQLRRSFEAPSVGHDRDLRLWENDQGHLMGFSELWIMEPTEDELANAWITFSVHPNARGGDLAQQIIAWAEERMSEVGRERQGQPKLMAASRNSQEDRIAILKDCGFVENRHLLRLSRSLTETIPAPQLPEGFIVRSVCAEKDTQAWVDLRNQAFIDHWGYRPLTVENYKHLFLQNPNYLPDLDLVAVDPKGQFASFCYCSISTNKNAQLGSKESWVEYLATGQDFRRRGFAKAMLLHGLHRLKALNMEIVKIGFDSENAFGARKLYESVGFRYVYAEIAYVKHL